MQFDVYENKNASTNRRFPYLLDVQADLLDSLGTRVVIPLVLESEFERAILSQLMPVLPVQGQNYVAFTPQLAGITASELGSKVENLSGFRTEIIAALDMLITGV